MPSAYDERLYEFQCESPECTKPFQKILRSLVHVDEIACPHCGAEMDIQESKSVGSLREAFDEADQIDLQRREGTA